MFDEVRAQLVRLNAPEVQLHIDERRGKAFSVVKVSIANRSCSVATSGFLQMLKSLPDGAGVAEIEKRT